MLDRETVDLIAGARQAAVADVAAKAAMCAALGIDRAALSNEGFAVSVQPQADLLVALREARGATATPPTRWTMASNRSATVAMLAEAGAAGVLAGVDTSYIAFFAGDP